MFIRFDTASGRELHRSTVPFTVAPDDGEADAEIPDETVIVPFGACRMKDNRSGLELDPTLATPSPPDTETFFRSLPEICGSDDVMEALGSAYPLFAIYLLRGYWIGVQRCLQQARVTHSELMSEAVYQRFRAAVTACHLPVVLPE